MAINDFQHALVTGASGGIGAAFALALARGGSDVTLVARSADRLAALATQIRDETGQQARVIVQDLAAAGAAQAVVAQLAAPVDLLINNAGFATVGAFAAQDPAREAEEIALNVGAVVALAHACLPDMLARGRGAIVNIASAAGLQPMPYMAVYGATKAFVYSFSDALWAECADRGVQVMAVCPGPVDTSFFEATGANGLRKRVPKGSMLSAEQVVEEALAGLAEGQRVVLPGRLNRATARLVSVVPRGPLTRIVGRLMGR